MDALDSLIQGCKIAAITIGATGLGTGLLYGTLRSAKSFSERTFALELLKLQCPERLVGRRVNAFNVYTIYRTMQLPEQFMAPDWLRAKYLR